MSLPFDFGANELPGEIVRAKEFDLSQVQSEIDFDVVYRNHAVDVKIDAEFDPAVLRKVDGLCENYDSGRLGAAIKDLEWTETSAKRSCYSALSELKNDDGGVNCGNLEKIESLTAAKARLENVLVELVTLRMAVDRLEKSEKRFDEESVK